MCLYHKTRLKNHVFVVRKQLKSNKCSTKTNNQLKSICLDTMNLLFLIDVFEYFSNGV